MSGLSLKLPEVQSKKFCETQTLKRPRRQRQRVTRSLPPSSSSTKPPGTSIGHSIGQNPILARIVSKPVPRRLYTTEHQKPLTFWLELEPWRAAQNPSVVPKHSGNSDCTAAAWKQRRIFKREKLALWPLLPNCSHSASAWPAAVDSEESGLCDRHEAGLEPEARSASSRPSDNFCTRVSPAKAVLPSLCLLRQLREQPLPPSSRPGLPTMQATTDKRNLTDRPATSTSTTRHNRRTFTQRKSRKDNSPNFTALLAHLQLHLEGPRRHNHHLDSHPRPACLAGGPTWDAQPFSPANNMDGNQEERPQQALVVRPEQLHRPDSDFTQQSCRLCIATKRLENLLQLLSS